jgi:hypothetical protein
MADTPRETDPRANAGEGRPEVPPEDAGFLPASPARAGSGAAELSPRSGSDSHVRYSADFPAEAESVAQARHWVADVLAECDLSGLAETACLLISELATNSLRHAESAFQVTIERESSELMFEVRDGSKELPVKAQPGRTDFGGKGLLFVDLLAAGWGSRLLPDGKAVFFTLEVPLMTRSA